MREQLHDSTSYPSVSRYTSIAQNLLLRHSKVYRLMYDKAVGFDETARVNKTVYSLPGCHFSPRMLCLNLFRAAAKLGQIAFFLQPVVPPHHVLVSTSREPRGCITAGLVGSVVQYSERSF